MLRVRGRAGAAVGAEEGPDEHWSPLVAGVPSTMFSQWKMESAGMRELMLGYHRRLESPSGKPVMKAEALRQAALKLMKNSATSHPFYSAGFVLVGDDR